MMYFNPVPAWEQVSSYGQESAGLDLRDNLSSLFSLSKPHFPEL